MSETYRMEAETTEHAPAIGTRLVVLMYDGAIGALSKALAAIEAGDLQGRCRAINMAMDILAQLCSALDFEHGGEIAGNLGNLYRYMIARLVRANLMNDPEPARHVLRLLESLYVAWRKLDEQVSEEFVAQRRSVATLPAMRAVG
jgi:flagellar protein FliS